MQNHPPGPVSQEHIGTEQPLPNETAILVLGIISIPTCFCYFTYGLVGIACGIISIVLANKAENLYEKNPNAWSVTSYGNVKAGRICAIVGLILNLIYLLTILLLGTYLVYFLEER